ncbi:hypothetical protein BJX62DRAFT_244373 [Aspergillus germanicus]
MNMNSQSHSTFLTALPLEIRLQIYRHVLPEGTVHFLSEKEYMFYVLCEEPTAHHTQLCHAFWRALSPLRSWGMALDNISEFGWGNPYLPPDVVSRGEVALLRVCRQVHGEVLPVLYGSVSFQVDELETWLRFTGVLGERLALVRSLRVRFNMRGQGPVPLDLYNAFWTLIATQMPGLLELEVDIDITHAASPLPIDLDCAWYRPLCQVRGLKHFVLGAVGFGGTGEPLAVVSDQLQRTMCSPREENSSLPTSPRSEIDLGLRKWNSGWRSGYRTDTR